MQAHTVLVIADDAEASVICAALAKRPEVHVIEALDARRAIKLLQRQAAAPALAIGGAAALGASAEELVEVLAERGIPLVAIAARLSDKARRRALAAGVKELHERPMQWHAYSGLIEDVIRRFGTQLKK